MPSHSCADPEDYFLPIAKGPQRVVRVDFGHARAAGSGRALERYFEPELAEAFGVGIFVNRLRLSFQQSRTS
jgi:hypothetical protein